MATITKKDIVDRITETTKAKQSRFKMGRIMREKLSNETTEQETFLPSPF